MQAPYVSSNSGGGWSAGRGRCTPILSLPHDQLHPTVAWRPFRLRRSPSSSFGDEDAWLLTCPPISGALSESLIGDVGLRAAACLWQAVTKRFTRRQLKAPVLPGAEAERRPHDEMSRISSRREQSAQAPRGRHSSWSTQSSWSGRGRSG